MGSRDQKLFESFTKEQQDHWTCKGCGKNCFLSEYDYYMIQDRLWNACGVGNEMLCIECLQTRIGRKLTYKDFTNCPLNEKNTFVQKLKKED